MKPDIVWSWQCFMFGIARQTYGFKAVCWTVCIGFLTLRWHWR